MKPKKRIIVVDDEPDTVKYLCTWLEDQGYDTYSATDGVQGMKLIEQHRPDLVLLDLKMPVQTGLHLYRELCLDESLRYIPVILITAVAEYHLMNGDCAPLPQPVACLDKPIDLVSLHTAIQRSIG
jgi:CheY-like chemotaxis protein